MQEIRLEQNHFMFNTGFYRGDVFWILDFIFKKGF